MAKKKRDREPRPQNIRKCLACELVVHDFGEKVGPKYFTLGVIHDRCREQQKAAVDRFNEDLRR